MHDEYTQHVDKYRQIMNIEHLLPLINDLRNKITTLDSQSRISIRPFSYIQENIYKEPEDEIKIASMSNSHEESKDMLAYSHIKNDSFLPDKKGKPVFYNHQL